MTTIAMSATELSPPPHKEGVLASRQIFTETSKVVAASYGYHLDFVETADVGTFATTFDPESGRIRVLLSPSLVARAESPAQRDLLSFAIGHELGHVKRFRDQPSHYFEKPEPRYAYFDNIVDDIAINQNMMRRTRYFAERVPAVYDQTLFPAEARTETSQKPKHMQFMDSLLMLSMMEPKASTEGFHADQLEEVLDRLSITVDPEVVTVLTAAIEHTEKDRTYNLLRLLRSHGHDYFQRGLVANILRPLYDALYESDQSEQQDGDGQPGADYHNSPACGHSHQEEGKPQPDGSPDESRTNATEPSDQSPLNAIGRQIAEAIEQTKTDGERAQTEAAEAAKQAEQKRMLEQLQKELGLEQDDFAGYLRAREQYAGEIAAFAQVISMLRHERTNNFLAPSHEVTSHGHRIDVGKLVGFIASGISDHRPNIFKAPRIVEKVEYEFDGLDMFLLCDISDSMTGAKARAAAASFVTILEGLIQADETAGAEDLVRVQIQAFGDSNTTVTGLTPRPTAADLGKTFAKISHPSESTYVEPSLREASHHVSNLPHLPRRLQIIGVISDGEFADASAAQTQGRILQEKGAHILQFVYGNASVSQLSDTAQIIRLDGAEALPQKLFELIPYLLEALRSLTHA